MFPEGVCFSSDKIELGMYWKELHMMQDSISWALDGFHHWKTWDGIQIEYPEEYKGHWKILLDFAENKIVLTKDALSA